MALIQTQQFNETAAEDGECCVTILHLFAVLCLSWIDVLDGWAVTEHRLYGKTTETE